MHKRSLLSRLSCTVFSLAVYVSIFGDGATACHAAVEFSTFSTGTSYNGSSGTGTFNGVAVSGSSAFGGAFTEGDEFTATFTATLSSIDVAVASQINAPGQFDLSITTNNPATNLPLVANQVTLGTLTAASSFSSIVSLTSPSPYIFAAGATYWLILSPHTAATAITWNLATDPTLANRALSKDGGSTYVSEGTGSASAFRINANSVPEPSSWALLVACCIGGVFGTRAAREQV